MYVHVCVCMYARNTMCGIQMANAEALHWNQKFTHWTNSFLFYYKMYVRMCVCVCVCTSYLSLTAKLILSPLAFLMSLHTLSSLYPAIVSPLTWRTWSPNLRPAMAAGDPFCTKHTKMPLLWAWNETPHLPFWSLQRTISRTPTQNHR